MEIERTSIMNYNQFRNLNSKNISDICRNQSIDTLYYPIDGTRTFYELFNENKVVEWQNEMIYDYIQLTRQAMINEFTMIFEYGIKNLIVLAMDSSAFNRGKDYLKKIINHGLLSVIDHSSYLEFFNKLKIRVIFCGLTHLYAKFGFSNVLDKMKQLEEKTKHNTDKRLFIYTGMSVNEDPLELIEFSKNEFKESPTLEEMIFKLYKYPLEKINLSIWYGQPRDKLFPLLITGNSARYYMENPSLSLRKEQFLRAIYSTIVLNQSHLDQFQRKIYNKEEKKKKYLHIDTLIGEMIDSSILIT